jgi:hypothetical protein
MHALLTPVVDDLALDGACNARHACDVLHLLSTDRHRLKHRCMLSAATRACTAWSCTSFLTPVVGDLALDGACVRVP